MVIDESGVGRAVGDMFDAAGLKPIRVAKSLLMSAHTNGARENDIGSKTVSNAQGQNPRKAAIHPPEDKHDQADAEHAKAQNRRPLQYAD